MRAPDTQQKKTTVKDLEEIEELSGKLDFQAVDNKLMHSVLENDQSIIDNAKIIKESYNQSPFSFTPDLLFEQLVKNYKLAKQIMGERLLRQLTGYDPSYIENNVRIPEFQRDLKKKIEEKIQQLKDEGFLDKKGNITEKGLEVAALSLYIEELDSLDSYGMLGEKIKEKAAHYGAPYDIRDYRKGDRYKDIALKRTIKTALRRKHTALTVTDLKIFSRHAKGKHSIIYGLDSSGSMKGTKIATCKKAGIALAFKALQEKDDVGLLVFDHKIQAAVAPCTDFGLLLKEITKIRPGKETDIAHAILESIPLFPLHTQTKHLLLLTDGHSTVGADPSSAALSAVEKATAAGITVSLIGIQLEKTAKEFAEKFVAVGKGRFYLVENLEDLDRIVLMEYYLS